MYGKVFETINAVINRQLNVLLPAPKRSKMHAYGSAIKLVAQIMLTAYIDLLNADVCFVCKGIISYVCILSMYCTRRILILIQ